eukprot:c10078_g1_i2.p1 GENE.c10078_g1_i2~~c10078_g1_i2.p1  ORF type:complete len:1191 (-),score=384.34 c10078_g1_i2:29-3601(-)
MSQKAFGDLNTTAGLTALNNHLSQHSYVSGYTLSSADKDAHSSIQTKPDENTYPHVSRWFNHILSFSDEDWAALQSKSAPSASSAPPATAAPAPAAKQSKKKAEGAADSKGKDESKPEKDGEEKDEPRSTERRDRLIAIQHEVQKAWDADKVFECEVPANTSDEKFFGCFPYPYMNGKMHLGHSFTLSKVEFAVGFQRMLGKHSFFPFAFHCTGMPIQACANKLKHEIATFGNPPQFPPPAVTVVEEDQIEDEDAPTAAATTTASTSGSTDPTKFKGKKSKAVAKTGGESRQWKIMQMMGFTDDQIPAFQDPLHWLKYFPPVAMSDIRSFGCKIDWRRSFITTNVNPYYDSFIRWQFWTLKNQAKVLFGKRYAVWSPKDGQPCADHDRASGEGIGPQEYTIIRMEVVAFNGVLKPLEGLGKKVYFAAATLRPETMYGQTNCWINPEGEYGAFTIDDKTIYILTARAARNLAFQDRSPKWGEVTTLATFKGIDLIGTPLRSPNSTYNPIYVLPMLTINTNKTTGVVTSVPSDSPDDYAALEDLKNKEALRHKYRVKDEWVLPFNPVPIIQVEGESDMYAVQVCQEMKIRSQNDRTELEKAHDIVYKKGYYQGTMKVGKYAGRKVEEAKPLIRNDLIESAEADSYAEPSGEVVSRSGDVCVVALCDQWYLDYGELNWLADARKALQRMNTYHDEVLRQLEATLGWLKQWACSREFGLGTKLPWDEKWLIESLSDSTIYMAYYTVAHLLQNDMYGTAPGPLGITAEQLTPAVWDHIFLNKPYPADCGIPKEKLEKMIREFNYWYPVDLRVSGKDLIQNHLTFFIYNHVAMFPEEKWPKGIRCNGHLLLDGSKMSKSTGNFLTMEEAITEFSSDATRLALADAGDTVDDANFVKKTADLAILRLTTLIDLTKSSIARTDLRTSSDEQFLDKWFRASMQKAVRDTRTNYQNGLFREALKVGFFDLSRLYGVYVVSLGDIPPLKDLVLSYLEVQALMLAPVTPHTCEHIWKLMGKSGYIVNARWPELGEIDEIVLEQGEYLFSIVRELRLTLQKFKNPKKGRKMEPKRLTLYVAKEFPSWQVKLLNILQSLYDKNTNTPPEKAAYTKAISGDSELKPIMTKAMSVAAFTVEQCAEKGFRALASEVNFKEEDLLSANKHFLSRSLELESVVVKLAAEATEAIREQALPFKPATLFEE